MPILNTKRNVNQLINLFMFAFNDFRRQRELQKALETPEEKRARRLAEKVCYSEL